MKKRKLAVITLIDSLGAVIGLLGCASGHKGAEKSVRGYRPAQNPYLSAAVHGVSYSAGII